MAIDTETKRRSALMQPWNITLPVPDGTVDAVDRPHVVALYAGIAIDAPSAPSAEPPTLDHPQFIKEVYEDTALGAIRLTFSGATAGPGGTSKDWKQLSRLLYDPDDDSFKAVQV